MRCPSIIRTLQIVCAVFILCSTPPLWAGVYYWTDENGVRHYSNVAPSESGSEVQRLDELPPSAPESGVSTDTVGTNPVAPAATEGSTPADPSSPANPGETEKSAEEGGPGSASEAAGVTSRISTDQNEIVQNEKTLVKELQRQLDQNDSRRDELIEQERQRLIRALEQLQRKPVSEFGSQKNKTRAMGYYRYRLEALQDSPDVYFEYGDSDID